MQDPIGQARESPAKPGDRVSHYEILAEIGRGGMGLVYRARDLSLDREVALKCLQASRALDEASRRRFLREPRAAARLSHPNVVPIFEVFEWEGTTWIAMQYVAGKSLRRLLRERGRLSLEEVLRCGEDVAGALQAAHDSQVIHRDVNPNNVMVTPDGRALLTDFGLARFVAPPGGLPAVSGTTTGPEGILVGTPPYVAPEQILGRPVDGRADIFSFGAMLYEISTGEMAFPAKDVQRLLDDILHHDPLPMGRLAYDIPEELDRIVRKALRKSPEERYQAAREMQVDLRTLRHASTDRTTPMPGVAGHPTTLSPGAGRRWLHPVEVLPRLGRDLLVPVLVILAALVVWLSMTRLREGRLPAGTARQVTTAAGWETQPALSPDGNLLAYVSDESGRPDLWLTQVNGSHHIQLTDDPAVDRCPAWFPDGSAIAFTSDREGRESIWKVSTLGGPATLLVPDAYEPAISPDGTRIAFARAAPGGESRIAVAPLSDPTGAQVRVLTSEGGGLWAHRRPFWSPDGRLVGYAAQRGLWVVPAAGGKARELTRASHAEVVPTWSTRTDWIYFSSYRQGVTALWRVRGKGGEAVRLTAGTGPESDPSLSRDGRLLAYTTYNEDPDVFLLDLETGSEAHLPGVRQENNPDLAPDGSAVVFASDRSGRRYDLWLQPLADGRPAGEARRLTEQEGDASHPVISPDGRWVAYYRVFRLPGDRSDRRNIWIVPVAGGAPVPVTEGANQDIQPGWSPDGSRIVFVSDREGDSQLWTAPVSGGRPAGSPTRIAAGPPLFSSPSWSPDGRWIACVGGESNESDLWLVPADGSGSARRATQGAQAHAVRWEGATGRILLSGTWGGNRAELRLVDPATGATETVQPMVDFGHGDHYADFSAGGGRRLLAYTRNIGRGDIWVLEASRGRY